MILYKIDYIYKLVFASILNIFLINFFQMSDSYIYYSILVFIESLRFL